MSKAAVSADAERWAVERFVVIEHGRLLNAREERAVFVAEYSWWQIRNLNASRPGRWVILALTW
jgi:hypothetical protein